MPAKHPITTAIEPCYFQWVVSHAYLMKIL